MRITIEPDLDGEKLLKPPNIIQPGEPPFQDKIVMAGVGNVAIAGDCQNPLGGPPLPIRFTLGNLTTLVAAIASLSVYLDHEYMQRVTQLAIQTACESNEDESGAPTNGRAKR